MVYLNTKGMPCLKKFALAPIEIRTSGRQARNKRVFAISTALTPITFICRRVITNIESRILELWRIGGYRDSNCLNFIFVFRPMYGTGLIPCESVI